MSSNVTIDRWQFAFTVTFHYLFPILTMGLAFFVVWLKTVAYFRKREDYDAAAHFWAKIFAVNFAVGVVTGVVMEFQFGTNWAQFSNFSGGVIGQTLAMEGMFAFFAESAFIGLFLAGRGRIGPRLHWISAVMVFVGSWVSGFFIIATNAWMQHPVAYTLHDGRAQLDSFWGLLTNPWLLWQYAHNMSGAVVTAAFVLAGLGAFYLLLDRHHEFARLCLTAGVVGALVFSTLQIFPTGDSQARQVAYHQPAAFAAMEGVFHSEKGAPLVLIGTPNVERRRLESTIAFPRLLSFLTSRRWSGTVPGLSEIPVDRWPNAVPLVYYAYHIMVGLGTLFFVLALAAVVQWRRQRLFTSRSLLWALMIAVPFTYIANIAGWTVAETGRQPWVAYNLQRTAAGASPVASVPSGVSTFTLLGFAGLYLALLLLFVLLIVRIVARGPDEPPPASTDSRFRRAPTVTPAR